MLGHIHSHPGPRVGHPCPRGRWNKGVSLYEWMALVLSLKVTLSTIAEYTHQISVNQRGIEESSRLLKDVAFAHIQP